MFDLDFQGHAIKIEFFHYHRWIPWPRKHTHEKYFQKIRTGRQKSRGVVPTPLGRPKVDFYLGHLRVNETPSPFLNIIDLYKFNIITILINDIVSASKPSFIAAKSFLDLLRISKDGMLEREAWNGARTTVTLNVAFIWGSSNPGNIILPRMSSSWVATMYLRWLGVHTFNLSC